LIIVLINIAFHSTAHTQYHCMLVILIIELMLASDWCHHEITVTVYLFL